MDEKAELKFKSRFSVTLRALSAALCLAFLLQDLVSAQGGSPVWAAAKENPKSSVGTDFFQSLIIPKNLGTSREKVAATSDKTIIQIQDAHDSLQAQQKITELLSVLSRDYDVRSVALEGSSGSINVSLFKTHPDREWAKKQAADFVKKGWLNAGEFFAATSEEPVAVYGVEKRVLYRENLKVFRDLLLYREKIELDVKGLTRTLNALSERVYGEELKALRKNGLLSDPAQGTFSKKWTFLKTFAAAKKISYESYANLRILAKVTELESEIDFPKANAEREKLLERFKTLLGPRDLDELVKKSLEFKAGRLTDSEFHLFLSGLARRHGVDAADYPNLARYTQYLLHFDGIDLVAVLSELQSFERALKEAAFANEDERILDELERTSELMIHLVSGEASAEEFEAFKALSERPFEADCRSRLDRLVKEHRLPRYEGARMEKIFHGLPVAKRFYKLAEKRNEALIRNTLKKMETENTRVAALVTGGFHTRGISDILKSEKLSYLVVLPKITDPNKKRPYVTILTRRPEQYKKTFTSGSGRYYIVMGTLFDEQRANGFVPDSRLKEMLRPLAENLSPAQIHRWMADYRKRFGETFEGGQKDHSIHPRKVEAILSEITGVAIAAARLAEATSFIIHDSEGRPLPTRETLKDWMSVKREIVRKLGIQSADFPAFQKQLGEISVNDSLPVRAKVSDRAVVIWVGQAEGEDRREKIFTAYFKGKSFKVSPLLGRDEIPSFGQVSADFEIVDVKDGPSQIVIAQEKQNGEKELLFYSQDGMNIPLEHGGGIPLEEGEPYVLNLDSSGHFAALPAPSTDIRADWMKNPIFAGGMKILSLALTLAVAVIFVFPANGFASATVSSLGSLLPASVTANADIALPVSAGFGVAGIAGALGYIFMDKISKIGSFAADLWNQIAAGTFLAAIFSESKKAAQKEEPAADHEVSLPPSPPADPPPPVSTEPEDEGDSNDFSAILRSAYQRIGDKIAHIREEAAQRGVPEAVIDQWLSLDGGKESRVWRIAEEIQMSYLKRGQIHHDLLRISAEKAYAVCLSMAWAEMAIPQVQERLDQAQGEMKGLSAAQRVNLMRSLNLRSALKGVFMNVPVEDYSSALDQVQKVSEIAIERFKAKLGQVRRPVLDSNMERNWAKGVEDLTGRFSVSAENEDWRSFVGWLEDNFATAESRQKILNVLLSRADDLQKAVELAADLAEEELEEQFPQDTVKSLDDASKPLEALNRREEKEATQRVISNLIDQVRATKRALAVSLSGLPVSVNVRPPSSEPPSVSTSSSEISFEPTGTDAALSPTLSPLRGETVPDLQPLTGEKPAEEDVLPEPQSFSVSVDSSAPALAEDPLPATVEEGLTRLRRSFGVWRRILLDRQTLNTFENKVLEDDRVNDLDKIEFLALLERRVRENSLPADGLQAVYDGMANERADQRRARKEEAEGAITDAGFRLVLLEEERSDLEKTADLAQWTAAKLENKLRHYEADIDSGREALRPILGSQTPQPDASSEALRDQAASLRTLVGHKTVLEKNSRLLEQRQEDLRKSERALADLREDISARGWFKRFVDWARHIIRRVREWWTGRSILLPEEEKKEELERNLQAVNKKVKDLEEKIKSEQSAVDSYPQFNHLSVDELERVARILRSMRPAAAKSEGLRLRLQGAEKTVAGLRQEITANERTAASVQQEMEILQKELTVLEAQIPSPRPKPALPAEPAWGLIALTVGVLGVLTGAVSFFIFTGFLTVSAPLILGGIGVVTAAWAVLDMLQPDATPEERSAQDRARLRLNADLRELLSDIWGFLKSPRFDNAAFSAFFGAALGLAGWWAVVAAGVPLSPVMAAAVIVTAVVGTVILALQNPVEEETGVLNFRTVFGWIFRFLTGAPMQRAIIFSLAAFAAAVIAWLWIPMTPVMLMIPVAMAGLAGYVVDDTDEDQKPPSGQSPTGPTEPAVAQASASPSKIFSFGLFLFHAAVAGGSVVSVAHILAWFGLFNLLGMGIPTLFAIGVVIITGREVLWKAFPVWTKVKDPESGEEVDEIHTETGLAVQTNIFGQKRVVGREPDAAMRTWRGFLKYSVVGLVVAALRGDKDAIIDRLYYQFGDPADAREDFLKNNIGYGRDDLTAGQWLHHFFSLWIQNNRERLSIVQRINHPHREDHSWKGVIKEKIQTAWQSKGSGLFWFRFIYNVSFGLLYEVLHNFVFYLVGWTVGYITSGDSARSFMAPQRAAQALRLNIDRDYTLRTSGGIDGLFTQLTALSAVHSLQLSKSYERLQKVYSRGSFWTQPGRVDGENIHQGPLNYYLGNALRLVFIRPFQRLIGRGGEETSLLEEKQRALMSFERALSATRRQILASQSLQGENAEERQKAEKLLEEIGRQGHLVVTGQGVLERLNLRANQYRVASALFVTLRVVGLVTGVTAVGLFLLRRSKLLIASQLTGLVLPFVGASAALFSGLLAVFFGYFALRALFLRWRYGISLSYKGIAASSVFLSLALFLSFMGWDFSLGTTWQNAGFTVGGHQVGFGLEQWMSAGAISAFLSVPSAVNERKNALLAERLNMEARNLSDPDELKLLKEQGVPLLEGISYPALRQYLRSVFENSKISVEEKAYAVALVRRNLLLGFFNISNEEKLSLLTGLAAAAEDIRISGDEVARDVLQMPLVLPGERSRRAYIAGLYEEAYTDTLSSPRFWLERWIPSVFGMWMVNHEIAGVIAVAHGADHLATDMVRRFGIRLEEAGVSNDFQDATVEIVHPIISTIEGDKTAQNRMDQGGMLGLLNGLTDKAFNHARHFFGGEGELAFNQWLGIQLGVEKWAMPPVPPQERWTVDAGNLAGIDVRIAEQEEYITHLAPGREKASALLVLSHMQAQREFASSHEREIQLAEVLRQRVWESASPDEKMVYTEGVLGRLASFYEPADDDRDDTYFSDLADRLFAEERISPRERDFVRRFAGDIEPLLDAQARAHRSQTTLNLTNWEAPVFQWGTSRPAFRQQIYLDKAVERAQQKADAALGRAARQGAFAEILAVSRQSFEDGTLSIEEYAQTVDEAIALAREERSQDRSETDDKQSALSRRLRIELFRRLRDLKQIEGDLIQRTAHRQTSHIVDQYNQLNQRVLEKEGERTIRAGHVDDWETEIDALLRKRAALERRIRDVRAGRIYPAGLFQEGRVLTVAEQYQVFELLGVSSEFDDLRTRQAHAAAGRGFGRLHWVREGGHVSRVVEYHSSDYDDLRLPGSERFGVVSAPLSEISHIRRATSLTEQDLQNLTLEPFEAVMRRLSAKERQEARVSWSGVLSARALDRYLSGDSFAATDVEWEVVRNAMVYVSRENGRIEIRQVKLTSEGWQRYLEIWRNRQMARARIHPVFHEAHDRSRLHSELQRDLVQVNERINFSRQMWRMARERESQVEEELRPMVSQLDYYYGMRQRIEYYYDDLRHAPVYNVALMDSFLEEAEAMAGNLVIGDPTRPILANIRTRREAIVRLRQLADPTELQYMDRLALEEVELKRLRDEQKRTRASDRVAASSPVPGLRTRPYMMPPVPLSVPPKVSRNVPRPLHLPGAVTPAMRQGRQIRTDYSVHNVVDADQARATAQHGYVLEVAGGFVRVRQYDPHPDGDGTFIRSPRDTGENRHFGFERVPGGIRSVPYDSLLDILQRVMADQVSRGEAPVGMHVNVSGGQTVLLTMQDVENIRAAVANGQRAYEMKFPNGRSMYIDLEMLREHELTQFYLRMMGEGSLVRDSNGVLQWVPRSEESGWQTLAPQPSELARRAFGVVVRTENGLRWRVLRGIPPVVDARAQEPGHWIVLPDGRPLWLTLSDFEGLAAQAQRNNGLVILQDENGRPFPIQVNRPGPRLQPFGSYNFAIMEPTADTVQQANVTFARYPVLPEDMFLPNHIQLPHRPVHPNPFFNVADLMEHLNEEMDLFEQYRGMFYDGNNRPSGRITIDQAARHAFTQLQRNQDRLRTAHNEFYPFYRQLHRAMFNRDPDPVRDIVPMQFTPLNDFRDLNIGHLLAASLMDDFNGFEHPAAFQRFLGDLRSAIFRNLDPSLQPPWWILERGVQSRMNAATLHNLEIMAQDVKDWIRRERWPIFRIERERDRVPNVPRFDRQLPAYGPIVFADHLLTGPILLDGRALPTRAEDAARQGLETRAESAYARSIRDNARRLSGVSVIPAFEAGPNALRENLQNIHALIHWTEGRMEAIERNPNHPNRNEELRKAESYIYYLRQLTDPQSPIHAMTRETFVFNQQALDGLYSDLAEQDFHLQRVYGFGLEEHFGGIMMNLNYRFEDIIRPWSHLSEAERNRLPADIKKKMEEKPDSFFKRIRRADGRFVYAEVHFGMNGLHRYITDFWQANARVFRDQPNTPLAVQANQALGRLYERYDALERERAYFQDHSARLVHRIRLTQIAIHLRNTYGMDIQQISMRTAPLPVPLPGDHRAPRALDEEEIDRNLAATDGRSAVVQNRLNQIRLQAGQTQRDYERTRTRAILLRGMLSNHLIDPAWTRFGYVQFPYVLLNPNYDVDRYFLSPSDLPYDAFVDTHRRENRFMHVLPNGYVYAQTATAALVDTNTGEIVELFDGMSLPVSVLRRGYVPDIALNERATDRFLPGNHNYPVMVGKKEITQQEYDEFMRNRGREYNPPGQLQSILRTSRYFRPSLRGVERDPATGRYYGYFYGIDFLRFRVDSIHPCILDPNGRIEVGGHRFRIDNRNEVVFGEHAAMLPVYSEEIDPEDIKKLWGLVTENPEHRDPVMDLMYGLLQGLQQAEQQFRNQGELGELRLDVRHESTRQMVQQIVRPGDWRLNAWEVRRDMYRALIELITLTRMMGRPEMRIRVRIVRHPDNPWAAYSAWAAQEMARDGGYYRDAGHAIHPSVARLYPLRPVIGGRDLASFAARIEQQKTRLNQLLSDPTLTERQRAWVQRRLQQFPNLWEQGIVPDWYTGLPALVRITGVREVEDKLHSLLDQLAEANRDLEERRQHFLQRSMEDKARRIEEIQKGVRTLEDELNRLLQGLRPLFPGFRTVREEIAERARKAKIEVDARNQIDGIQDVIAFDALLPVILREVVGDDKEILNRLAPFISKKREELVDKAAAGKAGARMAGPVDVYKKFYDPIRQYAQALIEIKEKDLGRSRMFLTPQAQLKKREERRQNGTFGVTEVFFVPPSETSDRMGAFQRELKNRFGDKVYLVDQDKLHLTTQGLESEGGVHSGMATLDPEKEPFAGLRNLARVLKTRAVKMQVASPGISLSGAIFWEVRPYLDDAAKDPLMDRRSQWAVSEPKYPHITAAYFAQPFSRKEMRDLKALMAKYEKPGIFGDIHVNEAQVIAYEDFAFSSGYKVLETIPFAQVWEPEIKVYAHAQNPQDLRAYRENLQNIWNRWVEGRNSVSTEEIVSSRRKFLSNTRTNAFYGTGIMDRVEPDRDAAAFEGLKKLQALLKQKLEEKGLAHKFVFLEPASFHHTRVGILDRSPEDHKPREYEDSRQRVERFFSQTPLEKSRFYFKGLSLFPNVVIAPLYPETESDYQVMRAYLERFKEAQIPTFAPMRPYAGHISLAYIFEPLNAEEYRAFADILKKINSRHAVKTPFEMFDPALLRFPNQNTFETVIYHRDYAGARMASQQEILQALNAAFARKKLLITAIPEHAAALAELFEGESDIQAMADHVARVLERRIAREKLAPGVNAAVDTRVFGEFLTDNFPTAAPKKQIPSPPQKIISEEKAPQTDRTPKLVQRILQLVSPAEGLERNLAELRGIVTALDPKEKKKLISALAPHDVKLKQESQIHAWWLRLKKEETSTQPIKWQEAFTRSVAFQLANLLTNVSAAREVRAVEAQTILSTLRAEYAQAVANELAEEWISSPDLPEVLGWMNKNKTQTDGARLTATGLSTAPPDVREPAGSRLALGEEPEEFSEAAGGQFHFVVVDWMGRKLLVVRTLGPSEIHALITDETGKVIGMAHAVTGSVRQAILDDDDVKKQLEDPARRISSSEFMRLDRAQKRSPAGTTEPRYILLEWQNKLYVIRQTGDKIAFLLRHRNLVPGNEFVVYRPEEEQEILGDPLIQAQLRSRTRWVDSLDEIRTDMAARQVGRAIRPVDPIVRQAPPQQVPQKGDDLTQVLPPEAVKRLSRPIEEEKRAESALEKIRQTLANIKDWVASHPKTIIALAVLSSVAAAILWVLIQRSAAPVKTSSVILRSSEALGPLAPKAVASQDDVNLGARLAGSKWKLVFALSVALSPLVNLFVVRELWNRSGRPRVVDVKFNDANVLKPFVRIQHEDGKELQYEGWTLVSVMNPAKILEQALRNRQERVSKEDDEEGGAERKAPIKPDGARMADLTSLFSDYVATARPSKRQGKASVDEMKKRFFDMLVATYPDFNEALGHLRTLVRESKELYEGTKQPLLNHLSQELAKRYQGAGARLAQNVIASPVGAKQSMLPQRLLRRAFGAPRNDISIVIGINPKPGTSPQAQILNLSKDLGLTGRADISFFVIKARGEENKLRALEEYTRRIGAEFSLYYDAEDLNAQSKRELIRHLSQIDIEIRPIFQKLLNGEVELEDLGEEKDAVLSEIFKLLPVIAPKSIFDLEDRSAGNAAQALRSIQLRTYHPSFGYDLNNLPITKSEDKRATIRTFDSLLNEAFFEESLAYRDEQLSGRWTVDDYVVVPAAMTDEDLRMKLGDRYDSFARRFSEDRIIRTDELSIETIFEQIKDKGSYAPQNVVFVDRFDLTQNTAKTLKQGKDQKLSLVTIDGPHAVALEKVILGILSGRSKEIGIKGLQKLGEYLYLYRPVLPIDFAKEIGRIARSKAETSQSA
jgi:hypothetical protein